MTIRRGHYHVREAHWLDDMEEGFTLAIRKLGVLMGLSGSHLSEARICSETLPESVPALTLSRRAIRAFNRDPHNTTIFSFQNLLT